jgi:hypothetical protein
VFNFLALPIRRTAATLALFGTLLTKLSTASAQTAPAEPVPSPSPLPSPALAGSFVVDVESLKPNTQFDYLRAENIGTTLCTAPCRAPVSPQLSYQVWGSSMVKSAPFQVPPGTKRLTIDPGSTSTRDTGFIVGYVGLSIVIPGLMTLGTGALVASFSKGSDLATGLYLTGGAMTGLGLVVTLIGVALVLTTSTSVTTDRGEVLARQVKPNRVRLSPSGLVW